MLNEFGWNLRSVAPLTAMLLGRSVFAQCGYGAETVPLPCPPGRESMATMSVNDLGWLCGFTMCSGTINETGCVWNGAGVAVLLPPLPGTPTSQAWDVNNAGIVAGDSKLGSILPLPCVWIDYVPTALGLLPNMNSARAVAISDQNTVVGYSGNIATNLQVPCMWKDGNMIVLDVGSPDRHGRTREINAHDEIVGEVWSSAGTFAVKWVDGVLEYLPASPWGTWVPAAISNNGMIVGYGNERAILLADGRFTDLGGIAGYQHFRPTSVNDSGIVMGECERLPWDGFRYAWVWRDGVMELVESIYGPVHVGGYMKVNEAGVTGSMNQRLTPIPPSIGDIDANCATNIDDLLTVISEWGATKSPADVNHDGIVDILDLVLVIDDWG